jgi:hypothetical protein
MESTTSSQGGFLSSPRGQQRLMWISGGILAVGIAVFLGVFLSRGTSTQPVSTVSTPPAPKTQTPSRQVSVKPATGALQVARTVLLTAVPRKNLDAAYDIVGPDLKGGFTRAQWRKGNIPVQYFPATNLKTAQFMVKTSTKNHLLLQVGLKGKPGSHVKSLAFYLGLDRIGGKWLVNYFVPNYGLAVRQNPNS